MASGGLQLGRVAYVQKRAAHPTFKGPIVGVSGALRCRKQPARSNQPNVRFGSKADTGSDTRHGNEWGNPPSIVASAKDSSAVALPTNPLFIRGPPLTVHCVVAVGTSLPVIDSARARSHQPMPRELIDTGTDKRFVRRNNEGRFKESDDVRKSLAADRGQRAKTKTKKGEGDKGDR